MTAGRVVWSALVAVWDFVRDLVDDLMADPGAMLIALAIVIWCASR